MFKRGMSLDDAVRRVRVHKLFEPSDDMLRQLNDLENEIRRERFFRL